jgi:N6-adenosine-specific RNA methylase IME4
VRYRTIVADPPWHYDATGITFGESESTKHALPYGSMTLDEIKALPVRGMSDNVDGDAHLYLWTTNLYLRDAFDVARAWGFWPSATIVWCKAPTGFSLGGVWPTNSVEFVLFCRRPKIVRRPDTLEVTWYLADQAEAAGITRRQVDEHMGTSDMAGWWLSKIETRCAIPTDEQWPRLRDFLGIDGRLDSTVQRLNAQKGTTIPERFVRAPSAWFQWPRTAHSAKPEAFLDLVESVSPGPYLELFARRNRLGWDTWGNEALQHVEMGA